MESTAAVEDVATITGTRLDWVPGTGTTPRLEGGGSPAQDAALLGGIDLPPPLLAGGAAASGRVNVATAGLGFVEAARLGFVVIAIGIL